MSPDKPVPSGVAVPFGLSTELRMDTRGLIEGDFFQRGLLLRRAAILGSGVKISVALLSTKVNPSCVRIIPQIS